MTILPKLIERANVIPIITLMEFLETDMLILKLIWKLKRPKIDKTVF